MQSRHHIYKALVLAGGRPLLDQWAGTLEAVGIAQALVKTYEPNLPGSAADEVLVSTPTISATSTSQPFWGFTAATAI